MYVTMSKKQKYDSSLSEILPEFDLIDISLKQKHSDFAKIRSYLTLAKSAQPYRAT